MLGLRSDVAAIKFRPILKAKPWGGARLAGLYQRSFEFSEREPLGESWELVDLPDCVSAVADGPLVGTPLSDLVRRWGRDLLGDTPLHDGRFPLLLKFIDAAQPLSVQVHPKPAGRGLPLSVKHEAWYIVHAEPDAQLYIGLKPGVTPADVAAAADSAALPELLLAHTPRRGDCYHLPSGVIHALGAGIVVAEVQTPSDTTYRLYDWNRGNGQRRALHVSEGLANLRHDVALDEIVPPRRPVAGRGAACIELCRAASFTIYELEIRAPLRCRPLHALSPRAWMILEGEGALRATRPGAVEAPSLACRAGDVVLVPAALEEVVIAPTAPLRVLEVYPGGAAPANTQAPALASRVR